MTRNDEVDDPGSTTSGSWVHSLLAGGLRTAVLLWLAFSALLGAWALASPQYASPDEPAHVFRAASVVRGEIFPHRSDEVSGGAGYLMVPEGFAYNSDRATCNAMHSDISAGCFKPVPADDDLIERPSGAAKYNPAYYLATGWPSLFDTGAVGFYGMRLVSLLICAAFLTSAVISAWRGRNARLWTTATMVAMTPMVLFMSSVVNPNGMEIAASLALWVALLRVATGTAAATEHPRLARAIALSASAVVVTRQLSPLWVAIIVIFCLLVARWSSVRAFLSRPTTWGWAGVFALSSVFALWWTLAVGTGQIADASDNDGVSIIGAVSAAWAVSDARMRDLVGNFGWLDAPASPLAVIGYWATLGFVVLMGLALARMRHRVAIVLLIVTVVALPLYLEATQFNLLGLFWQARYTLPLFVGIPLLAAVAIGESKFHIVPEALRRACRVAGVVWVLVQAASICSLLIRQRSGLGFTLNPFTGSWSPPGGAFLVITIALLGAAAVAWTVTNLIRESCSDTPSAEFQETVTEVQAKSGLVS